jgi:DnaD and phage-associated domain
MDFSLNMGTWNHVFAVPAEIADKHLKLAGKEQLRVILWLLRSGGSLSSLETISEKTGLSAEVAEEAIEYWIQAGLISSQNNILTPVATETASSVSSAVETAHHQTLKNTNTFENTHEENPQKTAPPARKRLLKPDGMYIAARINESESIRYLMQETESTLGKTLSPALSTALIQIHEDLGLPVEVIIMLIHYVKNNGKTGTSYIESVAKDWAESNVFTVSDAEMKLQELDEKQLSWKKVETTLGIYHRSPSKREETAAYRWIKEWIMPPVLISEAYERCVDQTGKLSVPYMNKILEKWHKSGIISVELLKESETPKETKTDDGYDISELEDMNFFNPVEE